MVTFELLGKWQEGGRQGGHSEIRTQALAKPYKAVIYVVPSHMSSVRLKHVAQWSVRASRTGDAMLKNSG
jgi:hypothetical protein